jgi:hypothetical protein
MNVPPRLASILFITIGQLWAVLHFFRELRPAKRHEDKACG